MEAPDRGNGRGKAAEADRKTSCGGLLCMDKRAEADPKSKFGKTIRYSINQEPYLKTFLENPEVPMDNNAVDPLRGSAGRG